MRRVCIILPGIKIKSVSRLTNFPWEEQLPSVENQCYSVFINHSSVKYYLQLTRVLVPCNSLLSQNLSYKFQLLLSPQIQISSSSAQKTLGLFDFPLSGKPLKGKMKFFCSLVEQKLEFVTVRNIPSTQVKKPGWIIVE